MSIEVDGDADVQVEDSPADGFDYLSWVLESRIWNGREVSWTEASDFHEELQRQILRLISENESRAAAENLSAQLAWIGSTQRGQSLLANAIEEVDFTRPETIPVGFGKSVRHFWDDHKKAILIGAAVVALVTVVAVVALTATAGAGAAAAGGTALNRSKRRDPKTKDDKFQDPPTVALDKQPPAETAPAAAAATKLTFDTTMVTLDFPKVDLSPKDRLVFDEKGLFFDGKYTSYSDILKVEPPTAVLPNDYSLSHFPERLALMEKLGMSTATEIPQPDISLQKSWFSEFFERVEKTMVSPKPGDGSIILSGKEPTRFEIQGEKDSHLCIGGINGIGTEQDRGISNARYLKSFTPNKNIEWVYNPTKGLVDDLLEALKAYLRWPSQSSELLKRNWEIFHVRNKDRPHAKYLQICHSKATIDVRNGLEDLPPEIRNRVIVVALAPATVIPRRLCYQSYNYASKSDPVSLLALAKLFGLGLIDSNECKTSRMLEEVNEDLQELILLEPHPDETDPHDFQGPTLRDAIERIIKNYLDNNGEYE